MLQEMINTVQTFFETYGRRPTIVLGSETERMLIVTYLGITDPSYNKIYAFANCEIEHGDFEYGFLFK